MKLLLDFWEVIKIKAIILAAGEGKRLNKYTQNTPKGMLEVGGKTIIKRQIEMFRSAGIDDIIVIRGFEAEKIDYDNVKYYDNEIYDETNMLYSLFCAEEEMNGDVIISYSDIVFEKEMLLKLIDHKGDVVVPVDTDWQDYWKERYGKIDFDTESLKLNDNNEIIELGIEDVSPEEMEARYVGLVKLSDEGCRYFKEIWNEDKEEYWEKAWKSSDKNIKNAYLTDMLQAVIDRGYTVNAMEYERGWYEFDTNEDYEKFGNEITFS
ncbi:phosphocholine cytidylyltransferase family protein [Halanaerobium sp. Z-7514]|uniref:Phosphocholine cytidylyltransferase family protein n=1 Tax=Halanaerobium polyolivorans TaxID=2886943 RepID=A0AAW4X1G5_9FIRM|nr:phosphocholine cytidylyltransferase family protein [Halanaerobium polyolivorans]MCC3145654.1 phosphocholine cytidylyltransferase family protein [Halanaerobium polyolivorans]